MELTLQGKTVVKGQARGLALVSAEPLSFWGGYDYHTGEITDRRHPLSGSIAMGRVLALPFTRGSSTTTAILLEAVHLGTAPAAILTTGVDAFFALASIVAGEMYASSLPIIALTLEDFVQLRSGDEVEVGEDGVIRVKQA